MTRSQAQDESDAAAVCRMLDDPDDCQLCAQESELEPGTFTPHEHAGDSPLCIECGVEIPRERDNGKCLVCTLDTSAGGV